MFWGFVERIWGSKILFQHHGGVPSTPAILTNFSLPPLNSIIMLILPLFREARSWCQRCDPSDQKIIFGPQIASTDPQNISEHHWYHFMTLRNIFKKSKKIMIFTHFTYISLMRAQKGQNSKNRNFQKMSFQRFRYQII